MMSVAEVRESGELRDELQSAFMEAFPTRDAIRHFLRHRLNRNLETLSAGGPLDIVVGDLIYKTDEGDEWLVDLVQAAYRHRPRSPRLREFATKVGWLPPESLPGLQEIAQRPETHGTIQLYSREISRSCRWARAVGDLKDMHDQLDTLRHQVYEPLRQVAPNLPMPDAVLSLATYAGKFTPILSKLAKSARGPAFAPDTFPWIDEDLAGAAKWLDRALAEPRTEHLNKALAIMRGVIEEELTALDRSLADATRELDLQNLVATLLSLQTRLQADGFATETLGGLDDDVETLRQIEQSASQLLGAHHRWQRVDARLNNLETSLHQTLDDIALAFDLLLKQLAKLQPDDGAADALEAADAFAAALDARNVTDIWIKFSPLASRLRTRFFDVDRTLLAECERIRAVGESLSAVVEKLDA